MITFAGAASLIVVVLYLMHHMSTGTVNKVGGCLFILLILGFIGFAGFMTLIMMFG